MFPNESQKNLKKNMVWFCFFIFWNIKSKAIGSHFLQRRKPNRPILLSITESENG